MVALKYARASSKEQEVLIQALCNAFASASDAQYASRFGDFAAFPAEHDRPLGVLPASFEILQLYMAFLALH